MDDISNIENEVGPGSMIKRRNKLHLGCGRNIPDGWVNVDGSWNARLAKYPLLRKLAKAFHLLPASLLDLPWGSDILIHDVRKRLPFQDHSFQAVYASHLLEHLYLEEAKCLLQECFRVLEPNGVIRLVVPDLNAMVREYMGERCFGNVSPEMAGMHRADRLNARLHLRNPALPRGRLPYKIYTAWKDFHSHKWMYDAESLRAYLEGAGFVNVQEMGFCTSRIKGIELIEQAGRVLDGEGICVEGIKPNAVRS